MKETRTRVFRRGTNQCTSRARKCTLKGCFIMPSAPFGSPKSAMAVLIMPIFCSGWVSAPSSQQTCRTRARCHGSEGSSAGPPLPSAGSSSMLQSPQPYVVQNTPAVQIKHLLCATYYSKIAAACDSSLRSLPVPITREGTRPSGEIDLYSTSPLPSSASTT